MIKIFLIVVGCYVLAGFLVHAVYRLKRQRQCPARHYVLLANPQHSNMERMIRSFFSFSRWMGVDVQLTVVDAGLSEQTREIIQRLNRADGGVNLYVDRVGAKGIQPLKRTASSLLWRMQADGVITKNEYPVVIDLQNPEDLSKIPF